MISGSTSFNPDRFSLMRSIKLLKRSSSRSRTPWVVALKSTRSMIPLRNEFSSAMSRRIVVSCSPILSASLRIIDQTGSSGFFGSSGRKKRTSFLSCLTSLNALAASRLPWRCDSARRQRHRTAAWRRSAGECIPCISARPSRRGSNRPNPRSKIREIYRCRCCHESAILRDGPQ